MHDPNPIFLTQGSEDLAASLADLLRSMDERGWLAGGKPGVQLRVARRHRSALVERTATALADEIARRVGTDGLAWADDRMTTGAGASLPVIPWEHAESVPVATCGMGGPIRVPTAWFGPSWVVTVTGVGADPHGRLWGALEAQAEPLVAMNPGLTRARIVYETHRLGASDLNVVCGAGVEGAPDRAWWVAGPSDIAVDAVLARLAGMRPDDLPRLRELRRHERDLPTALPTSATPHAGVRLRPASGVTSAVAAAWEALQAASAFVADDAVAIRRNLPKIPFFLRRYLRMFRPSRS